MTIENWKHYLAACMAAVTITPVGMNSHAQQPEPTSCITTQDLNSIIESNDTHRIVTAVDPEIIKTCFANQEGLVRFYLLQYYKSVFSIDRLNSEELLNIPAEDLQLALGYEVNARTANQPLLAAQMINQTHFSMQQPNQDSYTRPLNIVLAERAQLGIELAHEAIELENQREHPNTDVLAQAYIETSRLYEKLASLSEYQDPERYVSYNLQAGQALIQASGYNAIEPNQLGKIIRFIDATYIELDPTPEQLLMRERVLNFLDDSTQELSIDSRDNIAILLNYADILGHEGRYEDGWKILMEILENGNYEVLLSMGNYLWEFSENAEQEIRSLFEDVLAQLPQRDFAIREQILIYWRAVINDSARGSTSIETSRSFLAQSRIIFGNVESIMQSDIPTDERAQQIINYVQNNLLYDPINEEDKPSAIRLYNRVNEISRAFYSMAAVVNIGLEQNQLSAEEINYWRDEAERLVWIAEQLQVIAESIIENS